MNRDTETFGPGDAIGDAKSRLRIDAHHLAQRDVAGRRARRDVDARDDILRR